MRIRFETFVISILALLLAPPALAAMPADCSKGALPPGPAKGEIAHKPFAPTANTFRISQTMEDESGKFDDWTLSLSQPEGHLDEAKADITVLVHQGKLPDGRSFHVVPGGMEKQPHAAAGMPEVQGWGFSDDATSTQITSVFTEKASAQVNFGARKGNTISGTIYMCAPDDASGWVAGSFTATIEK